jgi:hypothetical protein
MGEVGKRLTRPDYALLADNAHGGRAEIPHEHQRLLDRSDQAGHQLEHGMPHGRELPSGADSFGRL